GGFRARLAGSTRTATLSVRIAAGCSGEEPAGELAGELEGAHAAPSRPSRTDSNRSPIRSIETLQLASIYSFRVPARARLTWFPWQRHPPSDVSPGLGEAV